MVTRSTVHCSLCPTPRRYGGVHRRYNRGQTHAPLSTAASTQPLGGMGDYTLVRQSWPIRPRCINVTIVSCSCGSPYLLLLSSLPSHGCACIANSKSMSTLQRPLADTSGSAHCSFCPAPRRYGGVHIRYNHGQTRASLPIAASAQPLGVMGDRTRITIGASPTSVHQCH